MYSVDFNYLARLQGYGRGSLGLSSEIRPLKVKALSADSPDVLVMFGLGFRVMIEDNV